MLSDWGENARCIVVQIIFVFLAVSHWVVTGNEAQNSISNYTASQQVSSGWGRYYHKITCQEGMQALSLRVMWRQTAGMMAFNRIIRDNNITDFWVKE